MAQNNTPVRSFHGILPPFLLQTLAATTNDPRWFQTLAQTQSLFANSPVRQNPANRFVGATGPLAVRETYDAKGTQTHPGDKARFEGEGPTGNKEVDDAFDFTGAVRDFYIEVHGRNGIDANGMKFVSTVNYGQNYENAFWNGSQMTYGRPGANSPFATFVLLDVCGHEVTHGVTEFVGDIEYYGQPGALNEHLSDVFGELIEQKMKGIAVANADWIIGNGIWKPNVRGVGLRHMLHPGTAYNDPSVGNDPQPDHMDRYVDTWSDNGGVHYNSGIPNRAFALFAIEMGGYAWEKAGKIWYAARATAGRKPSFAQFAYHTIEAAKTIGFGADVPTLTKCWAAVGISPSATAVDTRTPPFPGGPFDPRRRNSIVWG